MLNKVTGLTLYEKIVWELKNLIAQGVYKKGELLPSEKELMEMTGVSRVTVREALRILAEVGIIETKKGKGSFVLVDSGDRLISEFSDNTVGELKNNFIYSSNIRLLIEPEIARKATELCTAKDLEELSELLNNHDESTNTLDSFHRRIFKIVDNADFLAFFDRLMALESTPTRIRLISPLDQGSNHRKMAHEQHEKVLSAMTQRNPEFAYFYMKEHLLYLKNLYEEYFKFFI